MKKHVVFLLVALATAFTPVAHAAPGSSEPSLTRAGIGTGFPALRQDRWTYLQSQIENPTDQAVAPTVITALGEDPTLQFGARVWVPPRSRRLVGYALRPTVLRAEDTGVETVSLLVDSARGEQQLGRELGMLRADSMRPVMAALCGDGADDDIAREAVVAMRVAAGGGTRVSFVRGEMLPPILAPWQANDSIAISHPQPPLDEAQLRALRQWLIGGGKLWIMLDQVDQAWCARLLGEDWDYHLVDRVPMTQFTIRGPREAEARELPEPVTLARVVAPEAEVIHRVDGWPVSLRKPVGAGQVLVTTLGAAAWLDQKDRDFVATPSLELLAGWFSRTREEPPLAPARLEPVVAQQIGYQIMGRGPVMGVLAVLLAGLLALGLWLGRRGRLEHMATMGAAVVLLATFALLLLGSAKRGKTPLTFAGVQFVQVTPTQSLATVQGWMSIYSPGEQGVLSSGSGGVLWPDRTGLQGKIVRLLWTDMDRWEWVNLDLPSDGVRSAEYHVTIPLQELAARVRFGPDGLVGAVSADWLRTLEQPVIATPFGHLAPRWDESGAFVAGPEDVLPRQRFVPDAQITDLARQREGVYRRLLSRQTVQDEPLDKPVYPREPALLGWSGSFDGGLEMTGDPVRKQAAMVAVPLEIQPAAPGSKVLVPAPLVGYTIVRTVNGPPTDSVFYRSSTRRWLSDGKMGNGQDIMWRFELPSQVLPLQIESARLTLEIDATDRPVTLLEQREGQRAAPIAEFQGPTGRQTIDLPAKMLQPGAQGYVYLILRVGDIRTGDASVTTRLWELRDIALEVSGTVGNPDR